MTNQDNGGMSYTEGMNITGEGAEVPEDTREDKVFRFLNNQLTTRWCKAEVCACLGCLNRSYLSETRKKWYSIYPNEPFLREEEVDLYNKNKPI